MPVPFAKRELDGPPQGVPRWRREMLVLSGIILAMTALGPFSSYASPLMSRFLHWALLLLTGYAFFRPVIWAGQALADRTRLSQSAALAVACLLGAVPTSVAAALVFGGAHWREMTIDQLALIYIQVLIVGATVTVVQLLACKEQAAAKGVCSPDTSDEAASLLQPLDNGGDLSRPVNGLTIEAGSPAEFNKLLPPHLGTEVICLRNEDHYVRVYTTLGNILLLMRMRDAVTQLAGQGERVHRSWWVATAAVTLVIREGRNVRLRLSDGREVPVARSAVAELRAKGWLQALPALA